MMLDLLAQDGETELGFSDQYFTQVLLPDYLREKPDATGDWDVVFDARGHFAEPHTAALLPLGTLEVRQYLGDMAVLWHERRMPAGLLPTFEVPCKNVWRFTRTRATRMQRGWVSARSWAWLVCQSRRQTS
jgi:hypothetical protein